MIVKDSRSPRGRFEESHLMLSSIILLILFFSHADCTRMTKEFFRVISGEPYAS